MKGAPKMTDPNTKKCSRLKRLIDILTAVVSVVIAQIIADHFFEKPFIWTVLIMLVLWAVLMPVESLIVKKIDAYYAGKLES